MRHRSAQAYRRPSGLMFFRTDLRFIDKRWHAKAQEVKETVFSVDELGEREKARFDLEEAHRRPTGAENPETWRYTKPLIDVNASRRPGRRRDARDNPRIGWVRRGGRRW